MKTPSTPTPQQTQKMMDRMFTFERAKTRPKTKSVFLEMAAAYCRLENLWTHAKLRERRKLVRIAKTKTTTNCPWEEYGAAQHILRRAKGEGA